ncbi:MAG: hypothetical protein IPI48_18780 [bacterium]|nr:hypothetical protein [bacterium]
MESEPFWNIEEARSGETTRELGSSPARCRSKATDGTLAAGILGIYLTIITDRRLLEMKLKERSRALEEANLKLLAARTNWCRREMASIGQLAAGVAIDIPIPDS